jgi:hypothetical protein
MDNSNNNAPLAAASTDDKEKDMKAKRKYYGKLFVTLIFILIVLEYYVYVYQIMWNKVTCKFYFKFR